MIDVMKELRNPTFPSYIVNRAAGDSRSGGIFEDVFAQLIERYFQADIEFWTPEKEFTLKIKVNKPIAVPNERNKKNEQNPLICHYSTLIIFNNSSRNKNLIFYLIIVKFRKDFNICLVVIPLFRIFKILSDPLSHPISTCTQPASAISFTIL